jgi:alkylated DNA repair dioxygenase AlkB
MKKVQTELPEGFEYHAGFLAPSVASSYYHALMGYVAWEQPSVSIVGKLVPIPRFIAYFGDQPYEYSGIVHPPRPFPIALGWLLRRSEECDGNTHFNTHFNTALLSLYMNGQSSIGWHADDDYESGKQAAIASITLGQARRFKIRTKDKKDVWNIDLEDGSLLWMGPGTQDLYEHCLPKTKKPVEPRINITFRHICR